MFARLAFAAAVNVDPDIFLIDEALAVGDARFQRKCFAKFAELKSSGKTLIFVSHDIEAIAKHCDRVLFLEKGKLIAQGSPLDITSFYREVMYTGQPPDMETLTGNTSELKTESGNVITLAGSYEEFLSVRPDGERFHLHPMYNPNEHVFGGGHAHIEDFFFSVEDEIEPSLIESGSKSDLCVRVRLGRKIETLMWGVALRSKDGVTIFGTNSIIDPEAFDKIEVESGFVFKISQSLCLSGGDYFFDVGIVEIIDGKEHVLHFRGNAIHFTVADTPGFDGLVDLRVLR